MMFTNGLLSGSSLPLFSEPQVHYHQMVFDLEQFDWHHHPHLQQFLPEFMRNTVKKRQVEFALGRYCAAQALCSVGSLQTEVARDEHQVPVWPTGFCGAISHTRDCVMACVAESQHFLGLGLDVEKIVRPKTLNSLYRLVIQPAERAGLARSSLSEEEWATLIFSAKESLYKALYPTVLRYFGFEAAEMVTLTDQHFTLRLTADLTPQWRRGRLFQGAYRQEDGRMITQIVVRREA